MRRVAYSRRAIRDLTAIYRYISLDNPAAAVRMLTALYAACDGLANFPERGRRGPRPQTRELTTVAPYVIEYHVTAGRRVEIVRIWHGAQRRV